MQERTKEPREDDASSRDSCGRSEQQNEVTIDPFCSQKVFNEMATSMAAKDWDRACKTLMHQLEESAIDLDDPDPPVKFCERCRETASGIAEPASALIKKSQHALRECSRRYLRALRDLDSERVQVEGMAKRSAQREEELRRLDREKREVEKETRRLAEEKREVEREREQLRVALATREESGREGRTPPPGTLSQRRWK